MSTNAADPTSLKNLFDIVVPPPVPGWPSAPGWFVVGAVLLVLGFWVAWRAWRHWRAAAYRQTKTGVVVPFFDRLTALTGQHPAPGSAIVRPPWPKIRCVACRSTSGRLLGKATIRARPITSARHAASSNSIKTQSAIAARAGHRADRDDHQTRDGLWDLFSSPHRQEASSGKVYA
jgi:Domain of unknown function (DUF4381)